MSTRANGHAIALVACSKRKRDHPAPARDLYTGPLFRAARSYVESAGLRWYILSARHGLVYPDRNLYPYDLCLADLDHAERERWGYRVAAGLQSEGLIPLAAHSWLILAGKAYRAHLLPELLGLADVPLAGLGYGRQVATLQGWVRAKEAPC
jgi:hypothetical protein